MSNRALLLVLIAFTGCRTAPVPAKQNPSPMVDTTRAHQRLQQRELTGKRFTIDGVLPKPVDVLVTPAAAISNEADLLIHFHGAAWLPMQVAEDLERPLVVAAVSLGAGSSRYSGPFAKETVFPELVERIRAAGPKIRRIYLSGFSAGYGAIREILSQQPDIIEGVLLIDGLHASYVPEGKPMAEGGTLDGSRLQPFLRFAERASRGEKRFVIMHSEIFPGTFASTTETADWLLSTMSMKRTPVVQWGPLGMQQLSEARRGGFAVLGFAGNSAPDHIDQLHAMGTFLPSLWAAP